MTDTILSLRNPIWARVLPFFAYMLWLALDPVLSGVVGTQWAPWLYAGRIVTVVLLLGVFWRQYVEISQAPKASSLDWAWSLGLGLAVFVVWINLNFYPLAIGGGKGMSPPASDAWAWIAVRIFGAAIVVPIMEELFWRSFVMRWIDARSFLSASPAAVSLRAMLVSSLVFGLEHSLWFAGLLAGLAYAWLYRRGNLRLAIVSHGITNLVLGLWVVRTGQWQFW